VLRWHQDWPTFGALESVRSAAFSPDGRDLAIGSEAGVSLWELPGPGGAPQLWGRLKSRSGMARVLAFSADGALLASGSEGGTVTLWDVRNREALAMRPILFRTHSHVVEALAFSPDRRLLASGGLRVPGDGDSDEICVWDLATRTLRQRLVGHEDRIGALAFRPDGQLLASGSDDGTIRVWPTP
jgi:WD40 repeat protein